MVSIKPDILPICYLSTNNQVIIYIFRNICNTVFMTICMNNYFFKSMMSQFDPFVLLSKATTGCVIKTASGWPLNEQSDMTLVGVSKQKSKLSCYLCFCAFKNWLYKPVELLVCMYWYKTNPSLSPNSLIISILGQLARNKLTSCCGVSIANCFEESCSSTSNKCGPCQDLIDEWNLMAWHGTMGNMNAG